MKVKNLSELFNEFKKYREIKKNVAKEDNFYDYVSIGCSLQNEKADSEGNVMATDLIEDTWVTLKNYPDLILDFDFPKLNLKAHVWWEEIEWNMLKVLKDIWTTGEIKDTYGLDLNWPNNQQTDKSTRKNNQPNESSHSSPADKKLADLEKENQELKAKNEQLEKDKKIYWTIGGFIFLALVGLIAWLVFKRKKKNK